MTSDRILEAAELIEQADEETRHGERSDAVELLLDASELLLEEADGLIEDEELVNALAENDD